MTGTASGVEVKAVDGVAKFDWTISVEEFNALKESIMEALRNPTCQCGCGFKLQGSRGVLRKFVDDTHRCRARKKRGKR